MSGNRRHALLRTWVLPWVLLVMAVPASAAKLIHMNNGKVLRVESVKAEGEWLVVELDGGHTLGIRAGLVAQVEDDLGDNNDFGTSLNVVTSGRYVPRGRSGGFSNRQGGRATPKNALTEGSNSTPRPSQVQPGGVTVPLGQKLGPGIQPGTGTKIPAAQAGVNLSPGRRPNRVGRRPGNN